MRTFETEKGALQDQREMAEFVSLLVANGVRSYLEVGAKFGGLVWRVANALPPGARIAVIDLPGRTESKESLHECMTELSARGYDTHLHLGNSHNGAALTFARALGPFDAIMIDGDHSAMGVREDWANYGPLGRLVAFHDISWVHRPDKKTLIEVPAVWNQIKRGRRFVEIRQHASHCGIGVLWRK